MKSKMVAFFTGCLVMIAMGGQASASIFPSTVSELDIERYMGKWYEVQSTNPFFQKGCVCNTAEYTLLENGTVSVVNACNETSPEGQLRTVEGTASPTSAPGKFRVNFGGIPSPVPNYWVVDLAPDYAYAVVSTFFRNPVWILSRTPQLSQEVLDEIRDRLSKNGFDTSKLSDTQQSGCSN